MAHGLPVAEPGDTHAGSVTPRHLPHWARARVETGDAHARSPRLLLLLPLLAICMTSSAGAILLGIEGQVVAAWMTISAAVLISCLFYHWAIKTQRRARVDLRESERRFAEVFERAGISIWQEDWSAVGAALVHLHEAGVTDVVEWFAQHPEEAVALHQRITILDVNNHAVQLMRAKGKADLLGPLGTVLVGSHKTFGRWLTALSRGDAFYFGESVIERRDGEPLQCFVTAGLPADLDGFREIVVSTLDIADYKRDQKRLALAEEEMARAQRIVTMSSLSATIAHELKSPLAAVSTNAAACLRWLRRDQPDIEEAITAANAALGDVERVSAVIDRTRSYLGRSMHDDLVINVESAMRTAARLVENEARARSVALAISVESGLPDLVGDPIQVQQVLVNLMINGMQAMAEVSGEKPLKVSARRDGGSVRVDVTDAGRGIEANRLQRIFEPFHSTKESGMGLGLAICRNCIDTHGGKLWVDRSDKSGTVFSFAIPARQVI